MTDERQGPAPWAELAATVKALHDEVTGLRADLVPRGEIKQQRRRGLALVSVAVLLAGLLNNTAISGCFLAAPKAGSASRQVCGVVFWPLYASAMRQGEDQAEIGRAHV